MTTRTTSTTKATAKPQGSAPHPGGLTGRAGFQGFNFDLKGDHVKRKKLPVVHCECGGVMKDGVCQICRWWHGREEPPGAIIDLEAAAERLAAYICKELAARQEGGVR